MAQTEEKKEKPKRLSKVGEWMRNRPAQVWRELYSEEEYQKVLKLVMR